MTDHLTFRLKNEEIISAATEKTKSLVSRIRNDVSDPKTFKKAAEDLLTEYIAYSSVCCCVVSSGDMEKWEQMQETYGNDPEMILCALDNLAGSDSE